MPAEEVPAILKAAWSVCTPRDQPLVDQIVPIEREFLVKYAKYVTEVYTSKEKTFDLKQKENAIKDVVSTAQSRIAVLVKEVNPSLTHAVMAIVLYLLSNILTNDHVKYKTQDDMLAVYTTFNERPEAEKKNLFLTANWMNILFRVLPARKNKGIAMDIIPKFVEGNTAHYVTGGGQTQATRDRVFIYETEGDCKPIKRVKRKSRTKLQEEADAEAEEAAKLLMNKRRAESSEEKSSRKKISINGTSKDTITSSIGSQPFHSLPAAFYQAVPLPIPVISPRSQSSFSQAATVIANFGEVQTELSSNTTNNASGGQNDISYIISPRERYINIDDPRAIPNILKPEKVASAHPYSTTTPLFLTEGGKGNVTKPSSSVSFAPPVALTTGVSRGASTSSNFDLLVDTIGSLNDNELDEAGDQQLALLREASADSDI